MTIGPPDALGLLVWAHAGLLMELFGISWLVASRQSVAWRRTMLEVAAFNLLHGVTLVVWSMYGAWPDWVSITGNGAFQIASYVMLWRAGWRIVGMQNPDRLQAVAVLVPIAALMLCRALLADPNAAEGGISLLAQGLISLAAGMPAAAQLWRSGDRGLAVTVGAVCLTMGLLLGGWGLLSFTHGEQAALQHSSAPVAYVSLVTTFTINMAIAYAVFGRQLRELQRVTLNDAATGLSSVAALEQSLAFELSRQTSRHQRLAVLLVAIDGSGRLRDDWGQETFEAVVSEVAMQMRTRLSPVDSLAHAGGGRFMVVLFDAGAQRAHAVARNLCVTVQADAGLHPDGHTRLTLSIGVALPTPDSSPAGLLAEAASQCQQAQAEGGNRSCGSR